MRYFSSIKSAFNMGRRQPEYGPFFIKRVGDHGDVGYPPGFDLSNAEANLRNALETVVGIQESLRRICDVDKDLMSVYTCIQLITHKIQEFSEKLTALAVTSNDVRDFIREINSITTEYLTTEVSESQSGYKQVGFRALADVLQITRRSIPNSILQYSFSDDKDSMEVIRDRLVTNYIMPYIRTDLEQAAQEIIDADLTRPVTPASDL